MAARRALVGAAAALLAVSVSAATTTAEAADDHPVTRAKLDEYAKSGGPGTTVAAGSATDSWFLSKGTGVTGADKPIQPNEHFRAASQTKTFVAAVVMQLVDEGKVNLDDPIETYLPGLVQAKNYDGNKITVRQLLQHTSGIPSPALTTLPNLDGTYSPTTLVRNALSQKPLFAPGTGWGYSNTGFILASMVIEKVTGQTAGEAITNRLIRPLGLTGTRFPSPGDKSIGAPAVHGYHRVLIWVDDSNLIEPSFYSGAGALISTLDDLMTFDQALADGKVVSAARLADMRKIYAGKSIYNGYGLGLIHLKLSCGGDAWGHAGDLFGYSSLTMATDDGRHASVITNTYLNSLPATNREDVVDAALCETAK
ncbi:hypothetical protein VV02_23720 [Luteipulveratus mongoliensis]|uniref:Beta-lactamase-related domain-containing protein n=1 Tax=Luteipulveratus mongoliensis TaxID=571913 RepID=A0A0K1JRB4_9MICO|nr:hypothetical protein VV02_23720 [Luteipulveratus mongoliensis]